MDENRLIHELTQGLQMAQQLKVNLHSHEAREVLIQKILSSYENALLVLRSGDSAGKALPACSLRPESSISIGSLGSEEFEFEQPVSGQQGQNIISKRRKNSPTIWEKQVRISSPNGLEDNTDDGYNWRKYGQKDILGAKFPRSYYKCSYRKVQKCLATKQVQRTNDDPTVFEIAYKGKHTCNQGDQLASPPPPSPSSPEKHEMTPTHHRQQLSPPSPTEMLPTLKQNLSVNTSDMGGDNVPSSFSSPSTSFGLIEDHHQLHFPNYNDDEELLQVYSPPFISPSESNSFMEQGAGSSSLDFLADVDPDFEFKNFFL
ncbi:hypothetical protein QVD17_01916 [Tagetes erecta]|uniref:WRKY domain-containing protein n=1 Tax=Tagetes erecta TaxID=13708 RepID=A0AAD8P1X6_TARER|nr:hypothetical protein QVD17_01916 [Tagetes erecta]